jgi:alginate O-acetyltransferase complex protein AlgI
LDRFRRQAKLWVVCSLALNIGFLVYFKYANFMTAQVSQAMSALGFGQITLPEIALPIGISFFTFQKISYIVDVYRRHTRAMTNVLDFALYVAMFPQLVAGPIVRFKDIWDQLKHRQETWEQFQHGALRFCWGLGKKVLVADACGQIADAVFNLSPGSLDTKTAWLGAIAYTMQIYFDFSAYSDMAIGLARMFGFELLENFQRPYAAASITEFWRRWHISLSRWFRDYLYFPLGGNRKGSGRTYANLLVVFCLCGLWHGANWTFLVWGLYHGFFLILERIGKWRDVSTGYGHACRRILTMVVVVFGWVVFRSDSLSEALVFIKAMVLPSRQPLCLDVYIVLHLRNVTFFLIALISTVGASSLPTFEQVIRGRNSFSKVVSVLMLVLVLPYCTAFLMTGIDQPFIYFRF